MDRYAKYDNRQKRHPPPWNWCTLDGTAYSGWETLGEKDSGVPDRLIAANGEDVLRLQVDKDEDGYYYILGIDTWNANLVADAPLLLAENKRLRAACERVLRAIEWHITGERMTGPEQADALRAALAEGGAS